MRYALLVVALAPWLMAASCLASVDPQTGKVTPGPLTQVINTVAPLLPGPWGAAAATGSTLLLGVGSIFAKRKVNAEFAAKGTDVALSPVTKLLAERKWLLPVLAAAVGAGKALNIWDLDLSAFLTTLAPLGLAVGADVYEKKAATPAPATPPTP